MNEQTLWTVSIKETTCSPGAPEGTTHHPEISLERRQLNPITGEQQTEEHCKLHHEDDDSKT